MAKPIRYGISGTTLLPSAFNRWTLFGIPVATRGIPASQDPSIHEETPLNPPPNRDSGSPELHSSRVIVAPIGGWPSVSAIAPHRPLWLTDRFDSESCHPGSLLSLPCPACPSSRGRWPWAKASLLSANSCRPVGPAFQPLWSNSHEVSAKALGASLAPRDSALSSPSCPPSFR